MIITFRYKSLTWIRGSKNLYNVNFFACNCSSDWHDWRVSTQLPRDPTQCICYYFWRFLFFKLTRTWILLGTFFPATQIWHTIYNWNIICQKFEDNCGLNSIKKKYAESIKKKVTGNSQMSPTISFIFVAYFTISFKNSQTTIVLTFLTHNISDIVVCWVTSDTDTKI